MARRLKEVFRQRGIKARADLSKNERKRKSQRIVQRLMGLSLMRSARTLLSYIPTETEADPRKISGRFLKGGRQLAYPKTHGSHLRAVRVNGDPPRFERKRGILQPTGGRVLAPSQIDVALVPCVALDRQGHRVGRGEGYYDRFLKGTNALRVGLAFEAQIFKNLPAGRKDVLMDIVVTEKRVVYCSSC